MNTSTLRTLTLRAGLAVAAAGSLSVVSCGPELAPEISNLQATATQSSTGYDVDASFDFVDHQMDLVRAEVSFAGSDGARFGNGEVTLSGLESAAVGSVNFSVFVDVDSISGVTMYVVAVDAEGNASNELSVGL
ncbi:MAG: hypothetical protein KC636_13045 [Myxococcales bacterium]|nr:hypothetical protein [Myxococcales bacterium]